MHTSLMICSKNGNTYCFLLWKMCFLTSFISTSLVWNSFLTFVAIFYDFQNRNLLLNHHVSLMLSFIELFYIFSLVLILYITGFNVPHQCCNTTLFPFLNSIFQCIIGLLVYNSVGFEAIVHGWHFFCVFQYLLLTSN